MSKKQRWWRPGWRKMTWVLIIWCAIILLWAGVGGGNTASSCSHAHDAYLSAQTAKDACDTGAGIGIAIVLLIGFFGFVFLSLIWFMTRPKGRDCPACGTTVKRGRTVCPQCGHDFAAAARVPAATAG